MFYRETGQFKTSYVADMAIFPIRQDRIALWMMLAIAFIGVPLMDAFQVWPFASEYLLRAILIPFLILALATVSGVWSCGGASWAMYFAEEMHDARRKIGRVIAWTGVFAYGVLAEYALTAAWTTPLIWPAQPPHDIVAALCAGLAFVAGVTTVTVRGARDPVATGT